MLMQRDYSALVLAFLVHTTTVAAADINGALTTSDGKPIAGAVVRVYHNGGKFAGRTTTDAKGAYSLKIPDQKKIDWIQYDLTGFHPGTVKHLAGDQSQNIYKVLLNKGEVATIPDQVNQWAAYEQIFWIWKTASANGSERDLIERRSEYIEMMRSLRAMTKDPLVSANGDRILGLYEKEL